VDEGQLLAKVDDRLARADLAIKLARVETAEADLRATRKTKEEAQKRLDALRLQAATVRGSVSKEEMRAAEMAVDRCDEEENARRAAIAQARTDLAGAQLVVEMHEIRSPVRGVIRTIYKQRGEGVKSLDPVLQLQISK
jgi:multidrug resistance efflux pump